MRWSCSPASAWAEKLSECLSAPARAASSSSVATARPQGIRPKLMLFDEPDLGARP